MSYPPAAQLHRPCAQEWVNYHWWNDDPNPDPDHPAFDFWEVDQSEEGPAWVYSSVEGIWTRFLSTGEASTEQGDAPTNCSAEGPMMNGYWPLTDSLDAEEAAFKLQHLNTCVVYVNEVYGIALTGGGMDLSWELAYSAIRLGYLPWGGLRISQGHGPSTWHYGVHQIGRGPAGRVRSALRYRARWEIRNQRAALSELTNWK